MYTKHRALFYTLLLIPGLSACDKTLGCDLSDEGSSVTQVFQSAVKSGFSGNVLIRHRNEILLDEAVGFADRALAIHNSTDTVSLMGSITKQFTGALILSLQEAGLLHVDDKLTDHLNDVPLDKSDITIHQLLTHTAGFPSALGADTDPIDRVEYLELAWSTPLRFEPGSAFAYSNTGYSIAAAIIEVVTGQSYEMVLNERLLAPASIDETGYVIPEWSGRTIAKGYFESQSIDAIRLPWAEDGPYWNLRGNGGLLSTTSDLLTWHDALVANTLLSDDSLASLQGRHVATNQESEYYGYGWTTMDTPAGNLHTHNGSNGYHYASMSRFVDEDLIIVMLANERNQASVCLPTNLARASTPALKDWTR